MLDKYNHKSKYFIELNSLRFIGFLGIFFGHVFFSNNLEIVKSPIYTVFHDYGKILGFISLDSFIQKLILIIKLTHFLHFGVLYFSF